MKKITVALSLAISLIIASCGNNGDTSTNMPDSGYEPRTDTTNPDPVTTNTVPPGAVRSDSILNGQTGVTGVIDSADSKQDSAGSR